MKRSDYIAARAKLSPRARKVLARVEAGRFYRTYEKGLPKAMQELIDAGLVATAGRAAVIVSALVPTCGYKPMAEEKYEEV